MRTQIYMKSILDNKHLFAGKTVLDVGCGTAILSMFAAKAGAKAVYAVEASGIAETAVKIVKANKLDHIVHVLHGKMEEVTLPVEKVDIIISEWMGYFLLYESMLDTVLWARDKYLVTGGHLFPDKASLFITAIEDAEYRRDKIDFWDNVYGFDMSVIKEQALLEPLVDTCDPKQIITDAAPILDIDLYTVRKEDLDFTTPFTLTVSRDDYFHAFVAYFTCEFSRTHTKLKFSTSPRSRYTHWKSTVFYTEEPLPVHERDQIKGKISVCRNAQNPRDLDIELTHEVSGKTSQISRGYRLR